MGFLKIIALNVLTFLLAILPATTYREGIPGQPQSFLPSQVKTLHEHTVSSLIYRSLFKYDIYGALLPDLADTWSITEDGLVYSIKLKANQRWSNGDRITADDLIYTSYKMADLSGVATDKVDDLTVRYTLPNKYSPFLALLTGGVMHVNSEESNKRLMPISSGDWRVVSVEKIGDVVHQLVLRTRNENYKIKKLVFRYYSNEEELATAAKLGEIQGFLSSTEVEVSGFEDYKFPVQGIYYALYFNLADETVKDSGLRQKLEKALRVNEIIYDRGIFVEGPISRSIFTDRNVKFDKFDPAAKEDLSDLKLKITVPDIATHVETVDRVAQIWQEKYGFETEIVKVPAERMVEEVVTPRNFQVLFYGQEIGRDPDRYVNWHSTQKISPGLNISGFEQVRADRALEEGRKELDNDKRIIHYNEFQKAVTDNAPAIFLYHPYMHYYVSKYIQGIGEKYTFTQADRFLDFQNWAWLETN